MPQVLSHKSRGPVGHLPLEARGTPHAAWGVPAAPIFHTLPASKHSCRFSSPNLICPEKNHVWLVINTVINKKVTNKGAAVFKKCPNN